MTKLPQALVLGIGNLLWADEGFGVRAVEAMHARYEFGENVKLVDGGTQDPPLRHHRIGRGVDDRAEADTGDQGIQCAAGIEQRLPAHDFTPASGLA